jgi:hypothetical protein
MAEERLENITNHHNNMDTFLFYRIPLGMFVAWLLAMSALTFYHHYSILQYLPFILVATFGSLMFWVIRNNITVYNNFSALAKKTIATVLTLCLAAILISYRLSATGFIAYTALYSGMILFGITSLFTMLYIACEGHATTTALITAAIILALVIFAALGCTFFTGTPAVIMSMAMILIIGFYSRYLLNVTNLNEPPVFILSQWLIGVAVALGIVIMAIFALLPAFTASIVFPGVVANNVVFASGLLTVLTVAYHSLQSHPLSYKGVKIATLSILCGLLSGFMSFMIKGNLSTALTVWGPPTLAFITLLQFLIAYQNQWQLMTPTQLKSLSISVISGLAIMIMTAALPVLVPGLKLLEASTAAANTIASLVIVSAVLAIHYNLARRLAPREQLPPPLVGALLPPPPPPNPAINIALQQPLLDRENKAEPPENESKGESKQAIANYAYS